MTRSANAEGRIEFGTILDAALRCWGGFAEFPEGFAHAERVLQILSSSLGDVSSCYSLESDRCVAVRLADMPTANAAQINVGYVWVTPAALATGSRFRPASDVGSRRPDGP